MSNTPPETVADSATGEQQVELPPQKNDKDKSTATVVKIALGGAALVALGLIAAGGLSLNAERDQLKVELQTVSDQLAKASDSLAAMTALRDTAVAERDACAARAVFFKQGALLFSQEVEKYALNRFYSMDIAESLELIRAGNSMPCPD